MLDTFDKGVGDSIHVEVCIMSYHQPLQTEGLDGIFKARDQILLCKVHICQQEYLGECWSKCCRGNGPVCSKCRPHEAVTEGSVKKFFGGLCPVRLIHAFYSQIIILIIRSNSNPGTFLPLESTLVAVMRLLYFCF